MSNIYHLFHERFREGNHFLLSASGTVIATYEDLEKCSARYANRLVSLGLSRGDRVMVQVEKTAESLMLYFACLRAGLIYLPLNNAYRPQELSWFISDAEPGLIVCTPAEADRFHEMSSCPVQTLDGETGGSLRDGLDSEPATFTTTDCTEDDIAAILYTSGTTGKPKGAMISHGNLAVNALTLHEVWEWQPGDVMLHALPIFHVHGLFVGIHLAVLNASPIIFLPAFDAATVIDLLPEATVYMGVPTNYTRLLANPSLTRESCTRMRLFTSGSAPLLPQTFEAFRSRTGHTIVERYGMTETGMNTSNPVRGVRKPGTVGLPLPGVCCRILDEEGNAVATGETGHLQVKGDNVFRGYWRLPEKTREEFTPDGYFRTGDLASRDEDGYISIVGRSRDLIITGGFNVYPREVEAVIDEMPGVRESAVIGLPHPDFGEAVTAVVVRSQTAAIDEESIIAALKESLANFKVAKRVFFVDNLPRNTMGKVQKNVLREQFSHTD